MLQQHLRPRQFFQIPEGHVSRGLCRSGCLKTFLLPREVRGVIEDPFAGTLEPQSQNLIIFLIHLGDIQPMANLSAFRN